MPRFQAVTSHTLEMLSEEFGAKEFQIKTGVSRETIIKLEVYESCLRVWQQRFNLVGQKTLEDTWHRHFYDSAQLFELYEPTSSHLVDLGSGAGFPGMVLSIMGQSNVELIESNSKKCAFLTEVAQLADINVKITNSRVEQLPAKATGDIVTARALAPLSKLLGYVHRRLRPGGVAFLHKGATVEQDLTPACQDWKMHLRKHQSQTDPNGTILEVRDLVPSHAH